MKTELFHIRMDAYVDATLIVDLTPFDVRAVEAEWADARAEGVERQLALGQSVPEHGHWNWAEKADNLDSLAYTGMAIECENKTQSLMMVRTVGRTARLPPDKGKELVYVSYLETAPWNIRELTPEPQYKLAGLRLIEAAIRFSLDQEFHGRVGLHSLPQAERFYRETCGMTDLGFDEQVERLRYFEFTRDSACVFLGEESES